MLKANRERVTSLPARVRIFWNSEISAAAE